MKKTLKRKLSLTGETLRVLSSKKLAAAAGGDPVEHTPACDYSPVGTCLVTVDCPFSNLCTGGALKGKV